MERDTLASMRRALGAAHPSTMSALGGVAAILNAEGRYAEAEPIVREVVELQKRVLGPEHPSTLLSIHDLSQALDGQGKHEEGERLERSVLEAEERIQGREHADALTAREGLAYILIEENRLREAKELLAEDVRIRRNRPETNPGELEHALYGAAAVAARSGNVTEAARWVHMAHPLLTDADVAAMASDDYGKMLRADPAFAAIVMAARATPR